MQVRPENLQASLGGPLAPVYLVTGDETLLVEEACDAIIAAARQAGFTERSVHYVEGAFKWHNLNHDAASMSLFAERKILDVRVPAKKFDRDASDTLRAWVADENQSRDALLLLRTARLDAQQRRSAWFKALDGAGVICLIWPIAPPQLPRWLEQRSRSIGLQMAPDALQYLADRVEGNLLAAVQELQKLVLLELPQPVSLADVVAALEDTARFNSFDLLDAVMAGQPERTVRILQALREEGVAIFAILGALTAQMRNAGTARGLPQQRQQLLQRFLQRIRTPAPVLAECAVIDQQVKGQLPGNAWLSLENLLLRLAGVRAMPLPSDDQALLQSR